MLIYWYAGVAQRQSRAFVKPRSEVQILSPAPMFNLPKEIIVLDTEFTCWQGSDENAWTAPGQSKELVQIGAIRLRTSDFAEIDKFAALIKPTANPVLSDYFVELTGITQKEVDKNGLSFKKACSMFFDWAGKASLYSWSAGDFWALAETCKINNMISPFKKSRFFDNLNRVSYYYYQSPIFENTHKAGCD